MKTTFIDHGYGAVIGEYGAMARNLGSASLNALFASYRKYSMQYITRSMERHGLVPMYWDGGLFNRPTGTHTPQDIINAIVETSTVSPILGIKELHSIPAGFNLEQNYPNAFNPSTFINYQLPASVFVTLKVFDVFGREVETLVNEIQNAGNHSVRFDATKLSSGVYFYSIEVGTHHDTKKLLLLR